MTTIQITETYMENGYEVTSARIYKDGEYGYVIDLPTCDHCGAEAHYDGLEKNSSGAWSYMCEAHWDSESMLRLGFGWGQRLIVKN